MDTDKPGVRDPAFLLHSARFLFAATLTASVTGSDFFTFPFDYIVPQGKSWCSKLPANPGTSFIDAEAFRFSFRLETSWSILELMRMETILIFLHDEIVEKPKFFVGLIVRPGNNQVFPVNF